MSRRAAHDADALTATLLQAVKEARAAQTALEEAAGAGGAAATVEAVRERLALLEELRDMGMEIVRGLSVQLRAAEQAAGTAVSFAALVEAADVFAKLSRAIRLVMMLEMRAEEALQALLSGRPAPGAKAAGPPPPVPQVPDPTAQAELAAELAADLDRDAAPETDPAAEAERLVEREAPAWPTTPTSAPRRASGCSSIATTPISSPGPSNS